MELDLLSDRYAICRLDPRSALPHWASLTECLSITTTPEELSVVCREDLVPLDTQSSRGWNCLRVHGPLDLMTVGVLAELTSRLFVAGIPVFAVSTYSTDYLLVPAPQLQSAIVALGAAGHEVVT